MRRQNLTGFAAKFLKLELGYQSSFFSGNNENPKPSDPTSFRLDDNRQVRFGCKAVTSNTNPCFRRNTPLTSPATRPPKQPSPADTQRPSNRGSRASPKAPTTSGRIGGKNRASQPSYVGERAVIDSVIYGGNREEWAANTCENRGETPNRNRSIHPQYKRM